MEGFYQATQANLWGSVPCQGSHCQPSIAAHAAIHEASVPGAIQGVADGTLGVLEKPPVCVPYNRDSTGYTALPSGLSAALDELAAAIGITMEAGDPPASHATTSAAFLQPPPVPHLEPSGSACFHVGSSALPVVQVPGNAPTPLFATGILNPAPASAAALDQVMCVQGAQPLPLMHLQPLAHAPNPAESSTECGINASMASCVKIALQQPEPMPGGSSQPAPPFMLADQAQHLDRQNLPEQQKMDLYYLEAAARGPEAAVTTALPLPPSWTETEAVGSGPQPLDPSSAGQPPVTLMVKHGQEHNAQAVEQPKVQLTALQHPQGVASEPNPQSLESAQPPQSVPALQPFKAPTVAMLRAMRNSSIAASTAPVTGTCMRATATPTDANGLPAGAASCTPELPPGAQLNDVSSSASSSALCNRDQELLLPLGEPQMHTVGVAPGITVAPVVAELRLASTPAPADSSAPYDGCRQLPGQKLARCIQAASSGFGECMARSSEVRDGVVDATSGQSNTNQVSVSAGTDPAAGAVAPEEGGKLGHPSVGAAAEGLPSLLSADPEELAAAIAAAVAAVAAATRTTTEAAGQSAQADQQPSQPQLQVAQQPTQQPFAQQVLLPAAMVGSDPQLQQQHSQYPQQQPLPQHHQQPLVYTAMSNFDPTSQLQIQQQQQHQQPQSQQPQQLQVQFVPAGNGSGVLQVVAYGGNNGGAALPIASEGLPPAAAALLGAGLQPPAAVAIGGQMHVPVQQLQYGEVVQVAWPGSSGPVPGTVVYSQPGGFHQQQPQYQQQQELGTQPQVQDAYAHQVHDERYQFGAGNRQQQQLQQPFTLYDYDNQNSFQPPPRQQQQQPAQQAHYGSGPGAYDSRHEAPRHPTPYIYRPPVANTAADSCRDYQPPDPRTAWPSTDPRPGYVPLRHRAPSASFADGWHSTGRRTSHRQHPQHLLWSPPPSMLYTPTREYDEKSETPPPEVTGGSEEEPAAGTVAAGGLATASGGAEVLEAGNGKTKSAEMEVNGGTGAERISSPAADEGSLTLASAQQRGPCSATVAAIQLIEARRKQAQAKEQEAKEQKAKEQQEKEQQQHTEEQQNKNQQVKLPKVKDMQIKEVQAKGQQQPKPNTEQELAPAYPDTDERLQESRDEAPEPVTDEQPAVATADTEAAPQPHVQLQRPGPVASGRGSVQPPAVTGHVTAANALEPKPLGRNKEQARAEQDAATQAMLEKARRLRQQQLQERIQQERQRKEQEELRKQNKEQEEERLRERLRERLSQQQRAKAGGSAIGPAGPPVLAKPQGNVAAALAARLALAGRDAVGGAAAVAAAAGALGGACGATAAATAQSGGAAGQETRFQAELQELEADLESLEQQIASAPTYGMNARALVLRAAELVARRDAARALAATGAAVTAALKPAPATAPADAGPGLISVVKPLADAVPLPERAFVTYVPRSSIPRLVRQEAAHSLTGGYLALALQRARVPEARAVQAVTNEPELRKAAVAAAGQHEMALYRQVTSKMNYELLFRKTKAEPERLQLQEDVVQLLNKRYGNCTKGRSTAGGAAAPTALAAPKAAAAGADAARSVAAISAGTAGGGDGRSVMPGTKRRLVSPDDVSPPAAAPGGSKRVAAAGAVGAAAPAGGTGARKVAPAGGLVKVKHAVGRREDDTSDRAISSIRTTANVVVDELFVDSSSGDDDISGSRTVGSNEADTRAAARAVVKDVKGTLCTGAASEAKTGDVERGPADRGVAANPSGSAMGATDRGVGGGNSNPVLAVGRDYGAVDEGSADAPYEDLFGSDIDSGQECGTQMDVHTAKPAEGPAQTPVVDAQRLQGVHAVASAITVVCRSSSPAVGSAPTSRQAHGPKAGAAAGVTSGPAAAAEDGSFAPPAAVQGIDASAGCTTYVRNRKRQRVGEIGGTVGECDVSHRGRTEGPGLDKEPSRRSHVREKRRRSRSRSRSEGRPHNGDAARGLESKVSGAGGRQESLPLQGRGHGNVLCGDDGRQGTQCEGQPPHEHQQQPVAAAGSLSRAGMSQDEWEQTEVRQKLRQQVLAFIHATLEPLYRAGMLGKESYKRAAAKTCERLLSAHPDDIAPDFLVREHAQVSKFIMKVVEREQQRDAEQQPQHQEQKQQQAK